MGRCCQDAAQQSHLFIMCEGPGSVHSTTASSQIMLAEQLSHEPPCTSTFHKG